MSRRSRPPCGRARIVLGRVPFLSSHLQSEILQNALQCPGLDFLGWMTGHTRYSRAKNDPRVSRFLYKRAAALLEPALSSLAAPFNSNHLWLLRQLVTGGRTLVFNSRLSLRACGGFELCQLVAVAAAATVSSGRSHACVPSGFTKSNAIWLASSSRPRSLLTQRQVASISV